MIRKRRNWGIALPVVQRSIITSARRAKLRVFVGLACVFSTGALYAQATFTPLGLFDGTRSEARDVSADGSVVVGQAIDFETNTSSNFRWTMDASSTRLGRDFVAVSGDGIVVVGSYFSAPGAMEAYRWAADGTFEGLGDLPGGPSESRSIGTSVSSDGRVVVGYGRSDVDNEAFRWTQATGMVGLGDLPGGRNVSMAWGVSADGNVIVGQASGEAFRWTNETGMIGLGHLPNAASSRAFSVSADGAVIVGENQFVFGPLDSTLEAFRWTQTEGMVGLGQLPGGEDSRAYDVSADGSAIVGFATISTGSPHAFYWTEPTGMLDLRDLLVSLGATGLDGWLLTEARGISWDGRTIVGTGINPSDVTEAFVATIPEPSTITLSLFSIAGVVGLATRRRKQSCKTRKESICAAKLTQ